MTIFTTLEAAQRAGFSWTEFDCRLQLHRVEIDRQMTSGQRARAVAFARPTKEELDFYARRQAGCRR